MGSEMCIRDRSLGLGLARLVTLTLIDGNLRRQLTQALPQSAPSFFFVDVPSGDVERFNAFIKQHGGTCLLYTSDAADDLLCVDLGGRRIIQKKKYHTTRPTYSKWIA